MVDDRDNIYFKSLLDRVPAQIYFSEDDKLAIRNQGRQLSEEDGVEVNGGRPAKKLKMDPLNYQSVTSLQTALSSMDEKIKGKKESKQKKKAKKKGKETGVNMQEMQDKLRARIAELQAKRLQGLSSAEQQEHKRLERKQRRMPRTKTKNKASKVDTAPSPSQPPADSQQNPVKRANKPIINSQGKMVFSKFDFIQSEDKEKHSSSQTGKDYKRLLAKLEQRDAKVAKVKDTDPEAAARLEQKHVWQDVINKAKGEKVKDDPALLKKALKRKEKMKDVRRKQWDNRTKTTDKQKHERQEKREKNLQKRKDEKKAKHRKKLIKKGRILPGF